MASGVAKPAFHIRTCSLFSPVGVACGLAMQKIWDASANLPRKKAVVISLDNESIILAHLYTSPIIHEGCRGKLHSTYYHEYRHE